MNGAQSSRPDTVGCTEAAPRVPVKCRFPGPKPQIGNAMETKYFHASLVEVSYYWYIY